MSEVININNVSIKDIKSKENKAKNKEEFKDKKNILVHDSLNYSPGHGLWCVPSDKNQDTSEIQQLINNQKLLKGKIHLKSIKNEAYYKFPPKLETEDWLDSENAIEQMDKKVIEKLKNQLKIIQGELQNSIYKQNELVHIAERAEERCENFREVAEIKTKENEEYIATMKNLNKNSKVLLDQIDSLKFEILGYKEQIEKLNEVIIKDKKKIEELKEELKNKENELNEEILTLNTQLQKIYTQKDEGDSDKNETTGIGGGSLPSATTRKKNVNNSSIINLVEKKKQAEEINNQNNVNKSINQFTKNPNQLESKEFKLSLVIVDLKEKIEKLTSQNQIQYLALKKKKEENLHLKKQMEEYLSYVEDTKEAIAWRNIDLQKKKYENDLLKSKLKSIDISKLSFNMIKTEENKPSLFKKKGFKDDEDTGNINFSTFNKNIN